jgi:type IV pilus assembly protein PilX
MRPAHLLSNRPRERGAALATALVLLVVLTILGIAASRLQTGEAVMARNENNHQLALQAAEAALRDVEQNLANGMYSDAQFAGNTGGFYTLQSEVQGAIGGSIVDNPSSWTVGNPAVLNYTGPALSNAPASATTAQVVIENLPPVARPGDPMCSASYGAQQACSVYRVTARASGADSSASATLQSVIH